MCNFVPKITKLSIYKYNDMAYTILTATEAAAANAFTQGKSNPSSDNYDKTSLKMTQLYGATTVTAVPAADGTNMAVNALKFTPATAGTYIARYYNGTTAAYKVIKVVD